MFLGLSEIERCLERGFDSLHLDWKHSPTSKFGAASTTDQRGDLAAWREPTDNDPHEYMAMVRLEPTIQLGTRTQMLVTHEVRQLAYDLRATANRALADLEAETTDYDHEHDLEGPPAIEERFLVQMTILPLSTILGLPSVGFNETVPWSG